MRTLSVTELDHVSAAAGFFETVKEYTEIGATVGGFIGYVATATLQGATKGGVAGGAMGFAYGVGYWFGTELYEYFCH